MSPEAASCQVHETSPAHYALSQGSPLTGVPAHLTGPQLSNVLPDLECLLLLAPTTSGILGTHQMFVEKKQ